MRKIKGNIYTEYLLDETKMLMKASNTDAYTPVDKDLVSELKQYTWSQDKNGYFKTNIKQADGSQQSISLNTFIIRKRGYVDSNLLGDHIDSDPTNNVGENIRPATKAQNAYNKKTSKNNKLGITGIQFNKRTKTYRANIWLDTDTGRGIGSSKNLAALQLAYNAIKYVYTKEECREHLRLETVDPKLITPATMLEATSIIRHYIAVQLKNHPGRDHKELATLATQIQ